MNPDPLVSILMTAYNREQFITEAIDSVLCSSYLNWELIVIDDCSTDNTLKIARQYEASDWRIKVHSNQKNLGDYPNRNYAASLARGEFMMYVDSDDKILPDGISRLVRNMSLYPGASFGMYSPFPGQAFEIESTKAIQDHFFKKPFLMMGPGGTIHRRSFFIEINGYPEKYGPANDMYYNLKACCHTSIVIMPFDFMYYRRHEGQEINNRSSYLYNTYLYLKDALTELPLPLSDTQKVWINKKNKRRFSVNLARFFFKSFNITKIKFAITKTQFSVLDFFEGIFQ